MIYEEWLMLSKEMKEKVTDEELPVIPKEQLDYGFGVISAHLLREKDGSMIWEITFSEHELLRYPEKITKTVLNKPLIFTFNPLYGYYSPNFRSPEPTMEEQPIGHYGLRWMDFMKNTYEEEAKEMMRYHVFLTIARKVDKEAEDYNEILFDQYAVENPRPHHFEEILKWEEARQFYVESSVMRDVVLKMRT